VDRDEKPVLIAYDGSDHAKRAIEQAAAELRTPRRAVVVVAYEPLAAIPF
jgi:nucleotide-binding universal stress UspA family protein